MQTLFCQVLLPLHLPSGFTYRIPLELYDKVKVGVRVAVQFGKKKIIFVSSQATSIDSFSNCELLQLFETILEYNTDLIKDDTLDFWYEIKD